MRKSFGGYEAGVFSIYLSNLVIGKVAYHVENSYLICPDSSDHVRGPAVDGHVVAGGQLVSSHNVLNDQEVDLYGGKLLLSMHEGNYSYLTIKTSDLYSTMGSRMHQR